MYIRRRLLHALGWTVLSVPFYDYYRLGSTAAKVHPLGGPLLLYYMTHTASLLNPICADGTSRHRGRACLHLPMDLCMQQFALPHSAYRHRGTPFSFLVLALPISLHPALGFAFKAKR